MKRERSDKETGDRKITVADSLITVYRSALYGLPSS